MRITVIGGSGGTGAKLAHRAIATGHQVTVVSRRGTGPEGADVVRGDATHPSVVRRAVQDADAVVVTVGGAKGRKSARTEVTRAVIGAMQSTGVRRLLVQSSLGAGGSASQMPALLRLPMKIMLARPLADHDTQETAARASGLDWTIVRPTGLTDKPARGSVRSLREHEDGTLGGTIPREDLAGFMLDLLEDPATVGHALGVSS